MSPKSKTSPARVAHVFPGQGTQRVGMGKDVHETSPAARKVYKQADDALGFPLSRMCFEGPEEELNLTYNAQPAILTTSLACWKAGEEKGLWKDTGAPMFAAGHSLGEYTTLVVANVVDFQTAVRLVWERGRAMHIAGSQCPGGMLAILGAEESVVQEICQESGAEIANINCPGQIVLSGTTRSIRKAIKLGREKGVRKMVPLKVSGAFHSPLMGPAIRELNQAITSTPFRDPEIPIVANSSAKPLHKAAELKHELLIQLCHCVEWQRSIEFMISSGISTFIEVGPGKVLSGLIRRIDSGVATLELTA
ncbi:MAG: ACP S-malonyltransferase [Chloroflexi bacterium]|nr:ACP S-malonyltransferase [Chloroflexota bacterium]